ncbi:MAG: Ribonuclease HII [Parcubacteria group bacterium GW2011_GWA2_33_14]|uniref:Ribonuclease HII n=1 Tax=Candidatus Staskawiczbacteria bacterium RIFCSPHIGHO2_02_FULL_33_16 TaxID=1802204 RepID=A0A1G2HYB5_9BACT|nr:MAG: Ribonuclease HII [Parcubacteria group bacterium GW2011_GWA2_33_14]OGZ67399.1 MAG: ribonuclease HII [Candidatus Staskawiczbacteria bacterium RIFCSPHIGHO2_02_FULL_33_16]OGZ71033.1 MAG: ribonuclease HII [Candidatus Staskawiczbacteria bacterium RIFCSPLOWO2_01_FULL_33_13]
MKSPNLKEEKKLWRQGYKFVAGIDEAGRGPLAGPVTAAAVTVRQVPNPNFQFPKIDDSKKLSEKKREYFYEILTNHKDIQWGVGVVSEKVIDKINILEATKLSMIKAIDNLNSKSKNLNQKSQIPNVDFLLIDGNFGLKTKISQKSIIKGDQKVFSIAAASIIAKVTRDRIMQKMHKKYPNYDFGKHKGYGTALHIKNLYEFGPSKIHRKSFFPVSAILKD